MNETTISKKIKQFKKIKRLGILGGTFNPVHAGHFALAYSAFKILKLNRLLFIPNGNPPHKDKPFIPSYQRFKMLKLAMRNKPYFSLDDFELKNKKISYTLHTLNYIRCFYPFPKPLYFLLGMDSFLNLNQWHQFEKLFCYAHFVVFTRPHYFFENAPNEILKELEKRKNSILHSQQHPSGDILLIPSTEWDISSTTLRQYFQNPIANTLFLNKQVEKFILKNKVYIPR